jgi:hypothetical protein
MKMQNIMRRNVLVIWNEMNKIRNRERYTLYSLALLSSGLYFETT